ncbi:protein lin-9 homolog [Planococcus citri]|uniref:protein lin-9 homolog n=1 Tax=Planococcus citri TaxID=170843 RepID=UPI0031F767F5
MMNDIDSDPVEALISLKNGISKKMNGAHEEETEKQQQLSLFGLKRVEEVAKIQAEKLQQQPRNVEQVLNRRGTPARVRKKNKLFFDDDIYNATLTKKETRTPDKRQSTPKLKAKTPTPSKRPVKKIVTPAKPLIITEPPTASKITPTSSSSTTSAENKINQIIGLKLRNLLKLPKAYNWVCAEWFYSNIDRPLFLENNDFIICLKESFPQLKTYNLTRAEWCMVRRMMGKPRRCSQNFFAEEMRELERRRSKIRLLQQRKASEISTFKDVPEEIPLQPVIGTSVTARLRTPKKGLFTGKIDAVDTSNNTYRVSFDKPGLGTHSIPDYEVLSNETPETFSKSSLLQSLRPRNITSIQLSNKMVREPLLLPNDPMLSMASGSKLNVDNGMIGEYPFEVIKTIVRLKKILYIKKAQIQSLREMNAETERMDLYGQQVTEEFQTRYAGNIIALEIINHDLGETINSLNQHLKQLGPNEAVSSILSPAYLQDQSSTLAKELVEKNNAMTTDPSKLVVEDDSMLELITNLTALMLQIKSLAENDRKPYEVDVLKKTMIQIKLKLSPSNQKVFESCVEVHMQHIQNGLSGYKSFVTS